jgi:hypothetical protein
LPIAAYDKPLQKNKIDNWWAITNTYVGTLGIPGGVRQVQVSVDVNWAINNPGYAHFMIHEYWYQYDFFTRKWVWKWGWVNVNVQIPAGSTYGWFSWNLQPGEQINETDYTYDGPYEH